MSVTHGKKNDLVDVLIVGAGASGAAVAWSLGRTGKKVVCLEQGGWVKPSDYAVADQDWELSRWSKFSADPNQRGLPVDYPINDAESPITPLMYNAVGGSTIHWGGLFPRFHPSDFKVKSLDGVAADFPITYEELEPYFDVNDRMMGVAGLDGDPFYPAKSPRQMPPLALGVHGETIARAFDSQGWTWWPSDAAIATIPYGEGRRPCVYGNSCELGCPTGAKASTDITYWPPAILSGVELRTHARVKELRVGDDGRIEAAVYYKDGELQEQRARLFVLACNGIGTPRLLLNSASSRFKDGLANSSGQVGKNLMLHPSVFVTGYFDQRLQSNHGPTSVCVYSHHFYETDHSRDFVRGYQMQVTRDSGPLWTSLGGTHGQSVPWGTRHHEIFAGRFNHGITVAAVCEDLPEEHNSVTLDQTLTDSDSIPSPMVTYRIGANTNKMLDHATAKATELMDAAGAREIIVARVPRLRGWHQMGTARMGNDPQQSVVNRWGMAHDVPNLFLVDGSVLVTGSGVNPTSTIQAIALRTADYINQRHREL